MAAGPPGAASVSVCRGDSSTVGPGWWQWQCHSSVPAVSPGEGAPGAADSGGLVGDSRAPGGTVLSGAVPGWGARLSAGGQGQFCGSRLGATISPTNRGQGSSGAGAACPQGQSASATPLGSPQHVLQQGAGGLGSVSGCQPSRVYPPVWVVPCVPMYPTWVVLCPLTILCLHPACTPSHPGSPAVLCPLSPDCALRPPRWPHQGTSQCQNRNGTAGPQPPQAALLSPAGPLPCSQPARTNTATQEAWGIPAPCLW